MTGGGLRTAGDERRLEGSDAENGGGGWLCGRISPWNAFKRVFPPGDEELLQISSDGRVRSSN